MKKRIGQRKWKRHLAAKSEYQIEENRRHKDYLRRKRRPKAGPSPKKFRKIYKTKPKVIFAPAVLSLVKNTEATMGFFNEIRATAKSQRVFVDLSGVITMTPDAIVGLLATMEIPNSLISGNVPKDPEAARMINSSGFRQYVSSAAGYQQGDLRGRVHKGLGFRGASEIRFNQQRAHSLSAFAVESLKGPPPALGPSYDILCEAMLNTFTHAGETGRIRKPWWASIYVAPNGERAIFTFLDMGVGVFGSQGFFARMKFGGWRPGTSHGEFLLQLFKGMIPSSTHIAGRGYGIPEMYDHCKSGRVDNFKLIAGEAIADAETDTFRKLRAHFKGTLLYWEVRRHDDNDQSAHRD